MLIGVPNVAEVSGLSAVGACSTTKKTVCFPTLYISDSQQLRFYLISLTTHLPTFLEKTQLFSNRHSKEIFVKPTGSKNYNDDPTRRCKILDDRPIYCRYDTTPALDGGTD